VALMLTALVFAAGAVRRMQDGPIGPITWQAVPVGVLSSGPAGELALNWVAAGSDRFVAIGQTTAGPAAFVSLDGATWERVPAFDGALLSGLAHVDAGPRAGSFVAMGSLDGVPTTWWSGDGRNWTADAMSGERGTVRSVAAAGSTIVAIADILLPPDESKEPAPGDEAVTTAVLRWSTEPGRWQAPTFDGDAALLDGSGLLLTATETGFAALAGPSLLASRTGQSWSVLSDVGSMGQITSLTWHAGTFVVTGSGPDIAVIRSSVDGRTWADATLPGSSGAIVDDVSVRDGLFLAVGSGHRGVLTWHSTDARTWHVNGTIPAGDGALMTDSAWGPGGIVAVGEAGPEPAVWIGTVGIDE
jgi:hypothetical protein